MLALITLDKENEATHLNHKAEHERAIIITDTPPSVPKLTRSRARSLKRRIGRHHPITSLSNHERGGIVSLIKDDLHSDEEDEEYVVHEEDLLVINLC